MSDSKTLAGRGELDQILLKRNLAQGTLAKVIFIVPLSIAYGRKATRSECMHWFGLLKLSVIFAFFYDDVRWQWYRLQIVLASIHCY